MLVLFAVGNFINFRFAEIALLFFYSFLPSFLPFFKDEGNYDCFWFCCGFFLLFGTFKTFPINCITINCTFVEWNCRNMLKIKLKMEVDKTKKRPQILIHEYYGNCLAMSWQIREWFFISCVCYSLKDNDFFFNFKRFNGGNFVCKFLFSPRLK